MKILIPYDGSKNAEAALHWLQEIGYGENHAALILVADVFLPETRDEFWQSVAARRRKMQMSGISSHAPARRRPEEEQIILRELRERVPLMFPSWMWRFDALPGSNLVSSEILEVVEKWKPDVLILGAQSIPPDENTGFGGAARRIAKEARCKIVFVGDDRHFREVRKESEMPNKKATTAFDNPPARFARRTNAKPQSFVGAA